MLIPSLSVAPVAPVFLALSEPARSTKKNLAVMYPSVFSTGFPFSDLYRSSMMCCSMKIVKMAWLLEEASFIRVAAVVLLHPPLSSRSIIC